MISSLDSQWSSHFTKGDNPLVDYGRTGAKRLLRYAITIGIDSFAPETRDYVR